MPIKIPDPKTRIWNQPNNSDVLGSLWASFNLDLNTNQGKMRLGKRLVLNTSSDDVNTIAGVPIGYRFFTVSGSDRIYTVMGSFVYYASSSGTGLVGNYVKDVSSGAPTDCGNMSDIEIFNGNLYVTGTSSLYQLDSSGNWTTVSSSFGAATPHMMTVYGNRLYITDKLSNVCSMNTSGTVVFPSGSPNSVQYTLQLSITNNAQTVITCLRSSANRIWVNTENSTGGKGYVLAWDGSSNQATSSYRLQSSGSLACVIKDDIPYIVDSNANVLFWSGGNFQKVTGFYRQNNKLLTGATSNSNNRFIHPNGMSIITDNIHILINNLNSDNGSTIEETIPSGVWELDLGNPQAGVPGRGLIHKNSFSLCHATDTLNDFGQNRIVTAGALSELNLAGTGATRNGIFLAGAAYKSDNTTTKYGIFYDDSNDTLQKGGYFITPKIYSPDITNTWQSLYGRYRRLGSATDKIIAKYRIIENDPTEMSITWTSTTTFTTTDANMANYAVGDEVEITQGVGGGRCSHITAISYSNPTYTVTVDETYTGASNQTAKARFNQWIKMGTVNDQTSNFFNYQFKMSATSTWVQLKICMILTGRKDLEELQIQTIPSQDAK